MSNKILVTTTENILLINDIIHDCLFDKDNIIFEQEESTLLIKFEYEEFVNKEVTGKLWFIKTIQVPTIEYILVVRHVEHFEIIDGTEQGPGTDDYFNTVSYNPHEQELWISTIIAKGIKVKVRKLEIKIEDSGKIVKYRKFISI